MEDAHGVKRACLIVLLGLAALPVSAQETVVEFDPAQTDIDFTLGTLLHTVHGTFRLRQGTIRYDPATGKASGQVVVDATSGDSGNQARDKRMHSKIIESWRYPEIDFTPDHVTGALAGPGPWHAQLHGTFTILGVSHALSLPADVQMGPDHFTAAVHFVVPYVQWGMKNPSTFVLRVDETVGIEIHAAGRVHK